MPRLDCLGLSLVSGLGKYRSMLELRCTVRNCTHSLSFSESGLDCAAGHHFDRAKQGYWNLTQPQDKKSVNAGDHRDAVLARHRWLQRGHALGLVDTVKAWLPEVRSSWKVIDLGCGDGYCGSALFSQHASSYCGVDLSKPAIKLAARSWPEATWVLANADRFLPVADCSMDCAISLFGRRPHQEIRRVLKPDGIFIAAVPGEEDLIELREEIQQEGKRRNRMEAIIAEVETAGLNCVERTQWKTQVQLGQEEIADALAMTYRAFRISQQKIAATLTEATVTLSADLMLFRVDEK